MQQTLSRAKQVHKAHVKFAKPLQLQYISMKPNNGELKFAIFIENCSSVRIWRILAKNSEARICLTSFNKASLVQHLQELA